MGLVTIQSASNSAKFVTGPDLRPIQQASQGAVEMLESITATDMAQAVPFLQIVRVDPGTRSPLEDAESLNVFFQKPPEFGLAIADHTRHGERPPVSLREFKIGTTQDLGPLVLQDVEINLVVHRPDAFFDDPENNGWVSLITPGESHIVRYGWAGSSKNELVNGDVFCERIGNTTVAVDSIKSVLFTTYYYTFTIRENGEFEINIKGKQNGDFALRKMLVADIDEVHENENFDRSQFALNPEQSPLFGENAKPLRKLLQAKMTDLIEASTIKKNNKTTHVKMIDVMNKLVAPTIARRAKQWGYDNVELLLGNFNVNVGTTTKKYNSRNMSGESIGSFEIPVATLKDIAKRLSAKGSEVTMRNFMTTLTSIAGSGASWATNKDTSRPQSRPTIKIGVSEKSLKGKQILSVVVIDIRQELIRFDPSDQLEPDAKTGRISRDRIRKKVIEKGIPYVSFGNALSFIKDASFEVEMDPLIQRAMIERYAQHLKTRQEVAHETKAETEKPMSENFNDIWQSTLKGNVNMLGNFVFNVFSYIWIDFGVSTWNGLFSIRQRSDVLTANGFETSIEVYTEGGDPLNTKTLLSADQLAKEKELRLAKIELKRARKKAKNRAQARVDKANEALGRKTGKQKGKKRRK